MDELEPLILYTATLHVEEGIKIVGHSTGQGFPWGEPHYRYEGMDYPQKSTFRKRLEKAYEMGMGPVGQVRDMVNAMGLVAQDLGLKFDVPEATWAKVEEEIIEDDKDLAHGGVR